MKENSGSEIENYYLFLHNLFTWNYWNRSLSVTSWRFQTSLVHCLSFLEYDQCFPCIGIRLTGYSLYLCILLSTILRYIATDNLIVLHRSINYIFFIYVWKQRIFNDNQKSENHWSTQTFTPETIESIHARISKTQWSTGPFTSHMSNKT